MLRADYHKPCNRDATEMQATTIETLPQHRNKPQATARRDHAYACTAKQALARATTSKAHQLPQDLPQPAGDQR